VHGFFPGILPGIFPGILPGIFPGKIQEDSRKILEIPGRFQEDPGNSRKKIFLNNFRKI
jgi:hypothetical protein